MPPLDSVEMILCTFPISLNISHRDEEEEAFSSGAGEERAEYVNAGGREAIWCVGGRTSHSLCRLPGVGEELRLL